MKVKKFVASSMPEAMKRIRAELGNDAVILNSKIVYTGGFLGLFRKRCIEVIAAMDQVSNSRESRVKEKPINKMLYYEPVATQKENPMLKFIKAEENTSSEVIKELTEVKQLLQNISSTREDTVYPELLQHINQKLISQEIEASIRNELMVSLLEKWYTNRRDSTIDDVKRWCKEEMAERISMFRFGDISFSKKYVNVVGPTGVGKTTTLAKIAADSMLKFRKKVALITTDTYRIAAIEQLKTYAKILSVPLEVCYNLNDFKKACDTFKDFDVVLIDTAGRNFRDPRYVEELKNIIDYENEMETFLVLSLTSKQSDMEEIFKQFSSIDIKQFIFTKLDETATYGAMYNMIDKYQIGVAYLTNGQDVPDDKVSASAEVISKLILEDESDERSS
ncbi:flagellar biosynthesis protein FlhF [Robertmurraya siralis]|uniref:Flagellar biosynthesis protein FlhF n=1 Tax=Robertmurraya siralis TaxID=77777 RepID=A0A919WGY1_9BACI|nr:flagellar biosynthesis protein FlhF [Robertmurraya siralis]GIN61544.1 flagellar biosynthesis protein FlhF [Robertmurraya siralis]